MKQALQQIVPFTTVECISREFDPAEALAPSSSTGCQPTIVLECCDHPGAKLQVFSYWSDDSISCHCAHFRCSKPACRRTCAQSVAWEWTTVQTQLHWPLHPSRLFGRLMLGLALGLRCWSLFCFKLSITMHCSFVCDLLLCCLGSSRTCSPG